jgi:glucokinase
METEDPAAVISRHGLARTDSLSDRALDLFCEIRAQAGNLGARGDRDWRCTAGGIAPRIAERLEERALPQRLRDKGRMVELLSRIPVHVIMNPNVGLLGAAAVAARLA